MVPEDRKNSRRRAWYDWTRIPFSHGGSEPELEQDSDPEIYSRFRLCADLSAQVIEVIGLSEHLGGLSST